MHATPAPPRHSLLEVLIGDLGPVALPPAGSPREHYDFSASQYFFWPAAVRAARLTATSNSLTL